MSLSVPKSAVILLLLGGVWWLSRDGDGGGGRPTDEAEMTSPGTEAMRGKLELAVTAAVNAADCGYGDVGYDHRSADAAARHLVALMESAAAPPPGMAPPPGSRVEYVEGLPGSPWQVAVRPDSAGAALLVEGYGPDLSTPLFRRRVPCS